MKPRVVSVIPARGGSRGVPRKNIRALGGKPLLAYSIQTALECRLIDRVVVSTDDAEIADVARRYGAEVPFMRPAALATDESPEWLSWQHAIRALSTDEGMDVFTCLPPTSPLRAVEDVERCIQRLVSTDADVVISVTPASRNPSFNMVTLDDQGRARLMVPPKAPVHRRQDAPPAYDITTVAYAARPAFVLRASSLFEGCVHAVSVPPERAVDIDTELDLRFAEFLLERSR